MTEPDYDKIYKETYLTFIDKNIARFIKVLKPDVDEKREVRFRRERDKMLKELSSYREVKIGETNHTDSYFMRLQNLHRECLEYFARFPFKNFVKSKLPEAKIEVIRFAEKFNEKLFSLNEVETIQYLAEYYALDKIHNISYIFEVVENESIEYIETRLRNKLNPESNSEENQDEESYQINGIRKDEGNFTTARQVLVMHYFFEELSVDARRTRGAKARMIKLLTNKNYDTIYSILKDPLVQKELKGQIEDLEYVRNYFADLKLDEVTRKIGMDIISATNKEKTKQK